MRFLVILFMAGIAWSTAAWAGYPQDAADKKYIIQLLKSERFAELEKLFSDMQRGYEKGEVSELAVTNAFLSFANSDPEIEAYLSKWAAKFPDSFAVYQASGDYHQGLAWMARGSAWAKDTSKAQVSAMASHLKTAYQAYVHAIKLREKLIPAYVGLIRIGNGFGQKDLVQKVVERGLRQAPASYLIHYQNLFSSQPKWGGSYAAIESKLKKVRTHYGDNPMLKALEGFPHYVRANMLRLNRRSRSDVLMAEHEIDLALEAGANPMYLWEQGSIYRTEGRCQDAIASFSAALKLRPQESGILRDRGWCYYHQGDVEHALRDYNDAIDLNALASDTLRYRGILHYSQEQLMEAKSDLEASLVYGNHSQTAHKYLAYIYYNEKNFRKAEEHFGQAVDLGDRQPQDYFLLAVAQWKNHNCAFVTTAHDYLQLCGDEGGCKDSNMRWAKENAAFAVRRGICH
jgi:tetratricopeptide (TPR) repeat protein